MKLKIIFVLLVLAIAGSIYYYIMQNNNTITKDNNDHTQTCLDTMTITNQDTDAPYVWGYQDSEVIKAVKFDESVTPVLILDEENLLIGKVTDANGKSERAVVDIEYFSDIALTDATKDNTDQIIGTIKDKTFKHYSPQEITTFLLTSQLVNTYWHLHASLCMTAEHDTEKQYRTEFNGTHEYCTNECLSEQFNFHISIDKTTGIMTLTSEEL